MEYKYKNAHEWLQSKAQSWSAEQLRCELMTVALKLDCDQLQDIYQSNMIADGYFVDLDSLEPDSEDE